MNLTEQQQRALEHARDVLAQESEFRQINYRQSEVWRQELRMALRDVVAAFPADYPEQPPPDAGDSDPGGAS